MTNFAVSTGQLGAAIRSLSKNTTTATDVARIWLDILGVFFPNAQGFELFQSYSSPDCVLIEVQRDRDLDGDVIVDSDAKKPFLVVECRPHAAGYDESQSDSPDEGNRDDNFCSFGVVSLGAQAVFLKDVVSPQVTQNTLSLRGVRVGSANLMRASGRDKTEEWLRKIQNELGGTS
jgi:hypothetical protein